MKFNPIFNYIKPDKICTYCVMDSSVPGIWFDDAGICNFCKLHEQLNIDNPNDHRGATILNGIVNDIKRKGNKKQYDVIVGVSGGTDSTYLLHISKELGLNPLAVHLDNGWNTEISVVNLRNVLEELNIDLYTYVLNWEEFKDILLAQLKSGLPWADAPTDMAIISTLYRTANKFGIPHIFVGNNFRTEGKQPTSWTYTDGRMLEYIQNKYGRSEFYTYPNQTIIDILYFTVYKKIKMVRPFYYINYNKNDAKKLISEKYGWRDYGGHHHENIFTRYIIGVWLLQKFGIDKRKVTLSAYIRNREMTRNNAIQLLQSPPYNLKLMLEDHIYIAKKLGLSLYQFDRIWQGSNKTFLDYPSYYSFYKNTRWLTEKLFKYIFHFKPMMSYDYENSKITNKLFRINIKTIL